MINPRRTGLAVLALLALSTGCASDSDSAAEATADTAMGAMSGNGGMAPQEAGAMTGMGGMDMGSDGRIRLTARQAMLAGVSFAVAEHAPLARTVRAVAMVVPDEAGQGIVNTRVSGWVERLLVNETGRKVEVGEPLFELYAPDLVTAQEELLLARRLAGLTGGDTLVVAARRRLALWGIADSLIAEVERSGQVRTRLTIRSPFRGNVLEKRVIEGQYVNAGETLFEIADLSTVWIEPEVFEQDLDLVRLGQRARVTLDALPGQTYEGRVSFLYPTLTAATRTLKMRVEVPNPDGRIRPMMYGAVSLEGRLPPGVTVPLTAVLPTGVKDLAFVVRDGAVFPTEVVVGSRGDSAISVLRGLAAGDTVVASATFLFDSESSLAAAMAGIMLDMGMGLDMGGMDMGNDPSGAMDMGGAPPGAMDMDMPPDSGTSTDGGNEGGAGGRP